MSSTLTHTAGHPALAVAARPGSWRSEVTVVAVGAHGAGTPGMSSPLPAMQPPAKPNAKQYGAPSDFPTTAIRRPLEASP